MARRLKAVTRKKEEQADLTPAQAEALEVLLARVRDEAPYTTLRGYAGTGKTFVAAALAKRLRAEGHKVALCAPTHKAARVLGARLGVSKREPVAAQTLPALLRLRLKPDGTGGYALERERGLEPLEGRIVIADEASMIGRDLFSHIARATEEAPPERRLQWVFVGDPAQLPPVGEPHAAVFDQEGPHLTEVVRQEQDNPILALATALRSSRAALAYETGEADVPPEGAGVRFATQFCGEKGVGVTHRPESFIESALRAFGSRAFQRDPGAVRLLAYRNRRVEHYNGVIRAALRGAGAPRFARDEYLVASDTWFAAEVPVLMNSEEVQVRSAEESSYAPSLSRDAREVLAAVAPEGTGAWAVWSLTVRGVGEREDRDIVVLHEKEDARWEHVLAQLRRAATGGERPRQAGALWAAYYGLREAFARVDYAYAQTVHKAQGSTYESVFVDVRDLRACRGPEAAALLYVAVTRPERRLGLLV